jgi:hypothetical protein
LDRKRARSRPAAPPSGALRDHLPHRPVRRAHARAGRGLAEVEDLGRRTPAECAALFTYQAILRH